MSPTIRHLAFAAVTFAALAPAAAQAPVPGPQPFPPRVGLEGGVGLYGGEINCRDQAGDFCDGVTEAGGLDVHVTYMFTPRLGAMLDVWPMVHSENNWTFTHNVVTVGVKWRPAPIFTLTAGVGSAQARLRYETLGLEGRSEVASAILLAAGVDVVRGRKWAIDVEARLGAGFYGADKDNDGNPDIQGRNVGLGAAITWW